VCLVRGLHVGVVGLGMVLAYEDRGCLFFTEIIF
jgi:hypothetical protein